MIIVKNTMRTIDGKLEICVPKQFRKKRIEVIVKVEDEIIKKLLLDSVCIETKEKHFSRDDLYGPR